MQGEAAVLCDVLCAVLCDALCAALCALLCCGECCAVCCAVLITKHVTLSRAAGPLGEPAAAVPAGGCTRLRLLHLVQVR